MSRTDAVVWLLVVAIVAVAGASPAQIATAALTSAVVLWLMNRKRHAD